MTGTSTNLERAVRKLRRRRLHYLLSFPMFFGFGITGFALSYAFGFSNTLWAVTGAMLGAAYLGVNSVLFYYAKCPQCGMRFFQRVLFYNPFTNVCYGCGFSIRHPPGHCQTCGYDLRGLTEPTCPECGQVFDRGELKRISGAPDIQFTMPDVLKKDSR